MNAYECFYERQRCTVHAASTYAAQQLAARTLRVPERKRYQITVMLAATPQGPVAHDGAEL
jgi:hypothetical protein